MNLDQTIFAALEPIALVIGFMVMGAGGIMLSGVLVYLPCNIAWQKFGDTVAFVRVIREAKRQGVKIWRDDNED